MTAYAPNDTPRATRVRDAWTTYRDTLAGVAGPAYDTAEAASWERLQEALREIDDEQAERR